MATSLIKEITFRKSEVIKMPELKNNFFEGIFLDMKAVHAIVWRIFIIFQKTNNLSAATCYRQFRQKKNCLRMPHNMG